MKEISNTFDMLYIEVRCKKSFALLFGTNTMFAVPAAKLKELLDKKLGKDYYIIRKFYDSNKALDEDWDFVVQDKGWDKKND